MNDAVSGCPLFMFTESRTAFFPMVVLTVVTRLRADSPAAAQSLEIQSRLPQVWPFFDRVQTG